MTDSNDVGGLDVRTPADLDRLNFDKANGLVTVVTQDHLSGAVLMVAYADRDALACTLESREMHYTSRTRGAWHKGATSGNTQALVSLTADCDGDAVLARVRPKGPACHEGTFSCFRDAAMAADALGVLDSTIASRAADVAATVKTGESSGNATAQKPSWTVRLLTDRNLRHKKLGEEAVELTMACLDGDQSGAAEEGADLIYHALVALRAVGVSLDDVRRVLDERVR